MEPLIFAELFQKYIYGNASPAEVKELRRFIQDADYAAEFHVLLQQAYANKQLQVVDQQMMEEDYLTFKKLKGRKSILFTFNRSLLFRAAAILSIILISGIFYLKYTSPRIIDKASVEKALPDLMPGGDKAVLVLADGSTVLLDTAVKGNISRQGAAQVVVLNNGVLTYKKNAVVHQNSEILYNTIRTPKGGKYQIQLPDNSKVWLNAESSIRFTTVFTKERAVEVSGEVYFEVAASASSPFIVKTNDVIVQVLGTRFNINSYNDNGWLETTLVDGALNVCGNDGSLNGDVNNSVRLKPGQQAKIRLATQRTGSYHRKFEIMTATANIDKVMSWHRGVFNFEDETLEDVMRELARWYDIKVEYESGIPPIVFSGELSRDLTLSAILKALEDSRVRFRINGRTITVLNK